VFTGIIEELGTVRGIALRGDDATIEVACGFRDYVLGESIAVNGVCLSVTRSGDGWFAADASTETLAKTTLGRLAPGGRVHLERALRADARLGGHIVSGHVDGVGTLLSREPLGRALQLTIDVPPVLAPFLAPKGSVAVDGTSLTVNGARGTRFDLALVPVSQGKTLFVERPLGTPVNLEVDVLAKYVARLLGRPGVDGLSPDNPSASEGLTMDLLRRSGFTGGRGES
jgi:riboflavin synthase